MPVTAAPEQERIVSAAEAATVPFQRVNGAPKLDELWFFTGSFCNLQCRHCYVASSPANRTYEFLTTADAGPVLAEAARFGVYDVYFTGGEPFANPSIVPLLTAALAVARATVLTNGTEPLMRALGRVRELRNAHGDRLTFRVSLDHYEPDRHDAIRRRGDGALGGSFAQTVEAVTALSGLGFTPVITYTREVFRGNPVTPAWVERRTQEMFAARGVRVDVKLLGAMIDQGAQILRRDQPRPVPVLTDDYLEGVGVAKTGLMCHTSRMVAKRHGALHVYPCPVLVGADAASADVLAPFDLGSSLAESFARNVRLAHPSCAAYCAIGRATCANARAA